MDAGVGLHPEQHRHPDGARTADPGEVVAHEIRDHEVLGTGFGVGGELPGGRRIDVGIRMAGRGALDGLGLAPAVRLDPQETLRRGAQHREVPAPQEGRVRGRVGPALGEVEPEGRRQAQLPRQRRARLGREADLVGVPVADLRQRGAHGGLMPDPVRGGQDDVGPAARGRRRGCPPVGGSHRLGDPPDPGGVSDGPGAPGEVVDQHVPTHPHPPGVRGGRRAREPGVCAEVLQIRRGLVPEEPDRSTVQGRSVLRQSRHRHGRLLRGGYREARSGAKILGCRSTHGAPS